MPTSWDLRVIGEGALVADDGATSNLPAKSKRFAVLVFLAIPIAGRRVRRDEILAMFWPELDSARARNALRATLHQLRQTLGVDAIVGSGEEEIALNRSFIHVDFFELSRALDSGDALPWLARSSLDLVPGLHVPDAPLFQDWLEAQRQALNSRIVRAARKIADAAEAAGEFPRAVVAARAAMRLAREDETALRHVISLLDRSGDRASALAEFEAFERWVQAQYEVSPSPETVELVRRVRDRTQATPSAPHTIATAATIQSRPAYAPIVAPTGSGRPVRRAARFIILGAAAVVIVAAAVWRKSVYTGEVSRTPIAILPFRSELADTALGYCAPALGESIADELPSPAVVAYDATREIKTLEPAAIRDRVQQLGAKILVSGVLSGSRDSLNVQLTIASVDGSSAVRRVSVRASERQLVALRDTALAEIRNFAHVPTLRGAARHVPAPEAYQLSLNAGWLLGRRTRVELLKSRDLYTKALEIDPEWSELWLGLARVTGALSYRHFIEYRPGLNASVHAAGEALQRSPRDARALIERSLARFQLGDFVGAEADARRSAALDSTDWYMQSLIGTWWQWSGGPLDSALFYTQRARRIAPWDRQVALNILEIVGCMPDSVRILTEARRVLDIDPNEPQAIEALAWTLTRFGRWDEATRAYERRYASFVTKGVNTRAAQLTGEARFRATVRALRQAAYDEQRLHPPPAMQLLENRISLFEDLGMRDSSIAVLDAVVDSLDVHHTNMMCAPNLRDFRHDPRTQAIVKRRKWVPAEFARAY